MKLDPASIDLATLRSLWQGAQARLDEASMQRVADSAASVERIVAGGETVYGVNTGFGLLADTRIPDDRLAELQRNLILSHSAGLGEPLPRHVTRLMIILKLLGLGRGHSGVRPVVIDALQALLDRDAMPLIPSKGSVGASGDLAPLAHLIAALMGHGSIDVAGAVMPAAGALQKLGMEPLQLAPKEGLALINGTQMSTAVALDALFIGERVFAAAIAAGALAWPRGGRRLAESADEEGGSMSREKPVIVGIESLGQGQPMTGEQVRDFERRLRRTIEQRPLEESEDMLRQAIAALGTPLLLEAINQPQEEITIEGWDGIAADMAAARDKLPPEHRDEPWRSVILALVYRNDYADIFIRPSFALSAEMDRRPLERPAGLTSEEQHQQWLTSQRDLSTLPPQPHYEAYSTRDRMRLSGLQRLREVQCWTVESEDWKRLSAAIHTVRVLAAGIVLLRFCQTAERYLAAFGLPDKLPAFLTVDMATWPMETNTIDYCIYAVRRVEGFG